MKRKMLYLFIFILTASTALINQVMATNQLHLKGKVAEVLSVKSSKDSNGHQQINVHTNLPSENPHNIRVIKERKPASVEEAETLPQKITLEVQ